MYQISVETDNFYFLAQTCPKRVFPALHRCYIQISLGSKFFPEQTNLKFWTKHAQKSYLGSKPEKVNIPIEFYI